MGVRELGVVVRRQHTSLVATMSIRIREGHSRKRHLMLSLSICFVCRPSLHISVETSVSPRAPDVHIIRNSLIKSYISRFSLFNQNILSPKFMGGHISFYIHRRPNLDLLDSPAVTFHTINEALSLVCLLILPPQHNNRNRRRDDRGEAGSHNRDDTGEVVGRVLRDTQT